jgi:hypothetical protein
MVIRALLLGLILIASAGCASFPATPPIIGYDPTPNANAFQSAGTEAAIRHLSGRGLYETLGDGAYILSARSPSPCSEAGLSAFVRGESACSPLLNAYRPDCLERDFCLSFKMNSELAPDRELLAAVVKGLERPCGVLTPPSENPHHAYPAAGGSVLPTSYVWRYFRCSRPRQVQGYDVQAVIQEGQILISLRFHLQRDEPRSGDVSVFDRGSPPPRLSRPPPPPVSRPEPM